MALDERGEIFDCKCEGRNPECQICGGNGYYYQFPDSKELKEKISRPPDPFPLILKESSDVGNENSSVTRHLANYKSQLEKKRKQREMLKGNNKKTGKLSKEIERLEMELKKKRELLNRELDRDAKMLDSEKR
jgi:hypothetical protein